MAPKTTMDYIRETYVWCTSCQQLLKHDRRYCPLFPGVNPPHRRVVVDGVLCTTMVGRKWSKCACLVHTCSDNPVKLVYMGFARVSVSHYTFPGGSTTMCGRTPSVVGGVVKDPFRPSTCQQCVSVFLKRAHVYRDFLQAR
ncbi:hypothetical protein LCGC14_0445780 [marine sediment metagenome]|uniref:Uncharacterized protein n=1 Tax=marine sediment metagenome TaxID=412755 RepID=A0A0F9V5X1_9ZZZZ